MDNIHKWRNTHVSQTAMYSNIEILPSPLRSAFSKISERAEIGILENIGKLEYWNASVPTEIAFCVFLYINKTCCTNRYCILRSLLTFLVPFVSQILGNNRNHCANRASLLHLLFPFWLLLCPNGNPRLRKLWFATDLSPLAAFSCVLQQACAHQKCLWCNHKLFRINQWPVHSVCSKHIPFHRSLETVQMPAASVFRILLNHSVTLLPPLIWVID